MHLTQDQPEIQSKLLVLKGEIDTKTIIVGNFNTPLSSINRSHRGKNNKATSKSKHFYPRTTEHTVLSSAPGHILG